MNTFVPVFNMSSASACVMPSEYTEICYDCRMYKKAKNHFKKVDPRLYAIAQKHDIPDILPSETLYEDIVWTIIGQQLSGKAGDTIYGRFELLFPKKKITPKGVLCLSEATMRGAGLSGAKVRAIRSLSEMIISGDLELKTLTEKTDEEVMNELTKVTGIGPWTAEMVLMMSLGRTDIFSKGDLILKRQIMEIYNIKNEKNAERKIDTIIARWSPWKTYAAKVLWRSKNDKA